MRHRARIIKNLLIPIFRDARLALTMLCSCVFPTLIFANGDLIFQRYGVQQGLSQVSILALAQDQYGMLWVGTEDGLNRFDGHNFLSLRSDSSQENSLSSNHIHAIAPLPDGNLLIAAGGSIDLLEPRTLTVKRIGVRVSNSKGTVIGVPTSHTIDSNGNVWIGDEAGLLFYDYKQQKIKRVSIWTDEKRPQWHNTISRVTAHPSGTLWVASLGGLRLLDLQTQRFIETLPSWLNDLKSTRISALSLGNSGQLFAADTDALYTIYPSEQLIRKKRLAEIHITDMPQELLQDKQGMLWITSGKGLFLHALSDGSTQHFTTSREFSDTVPDNGLTRLLQDRSNNLWIGSYVNGLAKLSANSLNVRYFNSAAINDVRTSSAISRIALAQDNNVAMINPVGQISVLNTGTQTVRAFSPYAAVNQDVYPAPFVTSFIIDSTGRAWVSTFNGLYRQGANERPKMFSRATHPERINSDVWTDLLLDESHVWALSPYSGLTKINTQTEVATPISIQGLGRVADGYFPIRLVRANDGGFWFGSNTSDIAYWREGSNQIKRYTLQCKGIEHVWDIKPHVSGFLLLATNNGLVQFSPNTGECINITEQYQAPVGTANAIEFDADGQVWVSTNRGMIKYDLARQLFNLYDSADGFHFGEFNAAASLSFNDNLYFGSIRGIAKFSPLSMRSAKLKTSVQLTSFHVNFAPYPIPFTDSTEPKTLRLNRHQNSLSFQFTSDDLSAPHQYQYRYKLNGLPTDRWITTDAKQRNATFTELPPGHYTFMVSARRPPADWDQPTNLNIEIVPAWWETRLAYFCYAISAILLVTWVMWWRTRLLDKRHNALSKAVADRTQEITDLLKQRTRLFANLSHELRTPLTLIIGPLSDVVSEARDAVTRKKLGIVLENAKRLSTLVDQVLDITRLQDKSVTQNKRRMAIKPHLLALLESYEIIATRSGIALKWGSIEDLEIEATPDFPEILFGNLISNAIKYTNAGGTIHVSLRTTECHRFAQFVVRDNGIGMSKEETQHIFEPFYRAQHEERHNILLQHSSGLGLNHVREVVDLHNGKIEVSSEVDVGSTFIVTLPLFVEEHSHENTNSLTGNGDSATAALKPERYTSDLKAMPTNASDEGNSEKPSILIIEDNQALNEYLMQSFASEFTCFSAYSGTQAEALAYEHLPDIILSDIRLPELDGISLAEKLKHDVRTSHIPIILLTAMSDSEVRLTGLKMQVDDFISKPFDFQELRLRVDNLISNRRRLLQKINTEDIATPNNTTIKLSSVDQKFMSQLNLVIEAHIDNPSFELGDLGKLLYLSTKQVQRKVKALTGLSPMEYLRHHRIEKACQLLKQGKTISDVCYSVGFSSQSYFTTCFKHIVGDTPKNWQQKHVSNQNH